MNWKEAALTVGLYALLAYIAQDSVPGCIAASVWIGCGIHMATQSRSRGFIADASFVVTWPIYVALGR